MTKKVIILLICCITLQIFAGFAMGSEPLQETERVSLELSGALMCAQDGAIASIVLHGSERIKHVAMKRLDAQNHIDYRFPYDSGVGDYLNVTADNFVYGTLLNRSDQTSALNVGIISRLCIQDGQMKVAGEINGGENDEVVILLLSTCEKDGTYSAENIYAAETVYAENGEYTAVLDIEPVAAEQAALMIKHDQEYAVLYGIDLREFTERVITDYVDFDLGLYDSVAPMDSSDTKERFEQAVSELPEEVPVMKAEQYSGKIQFYVSKDGSDSNDGSFEKPFQSLQAAVSAAQSLSVSDKNKGVTIFIREGYYEIDKAISINEYYAENNAALYISAYHGEKVVFSGGKRLNAKDFSVITDPAIRNRLISEEARDKVLQINLRELGFRAFADVNRNNLFINRERMPLSRYPNTEETGFTEVIDEGPVLDNGDTDDGSGFKIRVTDTRMSSWENNGDLWAYGSFAREWQKMTAQVAALEEDILHILTASQYNVLPESRGVANSFYYYNVFEELDMPGEWYINTQTGVLYVYPTDSFFADEIVLSVSESRKNMIDITKSKNVIIDGIDFCHVERSAIRMYDCESCVVQRCNISNIGYCGVEIDKCRKCGAIENTIHDIGSYGSESSSAYGIWIGTNYNEAEVVLAELNLDRNFAQNNTVSDNPFFGVPMRVTHSNGNVLSHNLVYNSKGSGIRVSYCYETIVEYNEICGGPKVIWDAGAIYTGDVASTAGNHIRYNYLHDFSKEITKDSVGVYLDELGSDTYVYGNVIVNACKGVFMHTGRQNAVVNNVIAKVWENEGAAISDSTNHWQSDNTAWDKKLLADGTGVDILLPRFEGSEVYRSRYPNIYAYLKDVKELKNRKESSDYVRDEFEDKLKEPAYQYIASNVVIGDHSLSLSELGQKTALMENNKIVSLENYNDSIFQETVGFSAPDFDSMGLTEACRNTPETIQLIGSSEANEQGEYILRWGKSSGITHYEIEIASDKAFHNIVETGTTSFHNYQTVNCSDFSKELYWRVKGYSYVKVQKNVTVLSETGIINEAGIEVGEISVTDTAVSFRISNRTDEKKIFRVYAVKYEEINDIIAMTDVTLMDVEIEAGESLIKENLTIGGDVNGYVKLYLWDNYLEPMCEAVKIFR